MSKDRQITIKLDVCSATEVYDILLESQKNYSYEHCPARISNIREVIKKIKKQIDHTCTCKSQLNCPPGTIYINGECAEI